MNHLVQTRMRVRKASVGLHDLGAKARVQWARKRLTPRDEGPSSPSAVSVILFVVVGRWLFLDESSHDLFDVSDLDEDVLWFQIGMDDAAFTM